MDEQGNPTFADAIEALARQERGWEAAERAAAYPLDTGVVRLVKLPFADKNAIARALPAEVEGMVPYDLEDMQLATRLVDINGNVSRTAVFIAPTDELKNRIEALKAADADPKTMCMDADALASYTGRGVQVVVDVGHRRTLLALCQNGQLLGARLVASGGAELTRVVAEVLGCSFEDAEATKHGLMVPPAPGEARVQEDGVAVEEPTAPSLVEDALGRAVDAWCVDVRAELIALEDELDVGIDDLLLCGGGARLEGLGARLAARVGVPARPVVVPGGHGMEYALAVGLARAAAGELKIADLRQGELAYHGHAEGLWNLLGATIVGSTLALVAGVTLFGVQLYDANKRLDELDQQIVSTVTDTFPDIPADKLKEPSMALALMQERATETQKRVEALGATVSGVLPVLDMMKVISEHVPPASQARIDVRELTIAEQSVSFRAETDSYESAAKIEETLRREDRFKSARKGEEKKVGDTLTFTMTIPLGEEATAEAPAGEEG